MQKLTCEMCGSSDLIKQDGVFVCQSCGCKYSVEEAKKMFNADVCESKENCDFLGCKIEDKNKKIETSKKNILLSVISLVAIVFTIVSSIIAFSDLEGFLIIIVIPFSIALLTLGIIVVCNRRSFGVVIPEIAVLFLFALIILGVVIFEKVDLYTLTNAFPPITAGICSIFTLKERKKH